MPSNSAFGWEDKMTWDDLSNQQPGDMTVVPEEPVTINYGEDGLVTSVIYGNMKRIEEGEPAVIWSQDIIRDDNKKVIGIQTTRANGTITMETFVYDENGRFTGSTLDYL
jgi:hypothetical protein